MSRQHVSYETVPADELRRLREQASKLQQVNADLPGIMRDIETRVRAESQSRFTQMERRAEEYRGQIQGLHSQIGDMERSFDSSLQQQRQDFQRSLEDTRRRADTQLAGLRTDIGADIARQRKEFLGLLDTQHREFTQSIQEQDRRLTSLIAQERRERERQFSKLEADIHEIHADAQRKKKIATDFVEDAQRIAQAMGTTYDHAKHAPGELEKILRGELNAAQLSLRQGMPEAAVAQAQNAYMKLTELRIRLESLQQAYELHRSQALHDVAILLQEVEKNRIFRLQGNDYELNFWTRGKAEAFQKELEEIRAKILADTLDVPGLEELRKRIQMQGARFTELLGEAGEAILVSQKRYLVADQIAGILGAQGYSIEEGVYASEDFREGYHLKMRMVDNSEVIVSILPEGSGNTIRVDTFEATPIDEEDLRARSEDLFARLAAQGVRVDPKGTCRKNTAPDETVRDFSRIRSGRPKAEEGRRGTRG